MILGLAPMDGFTDCAFRQITKEIFAKYGEKEKYQLVLWTEFMNADGYMINPPGVIRHLLTDKSQSPVIAQIFGGNEAMLTQCFADIQSKYFLDKEEKKNTDFHFAGIELNMGCPARNVMNTGGGSALLKDRTNTLAIIKKLAGMMQLPFSIKTRIGSDENDRQEQMVFLVEASKYVSLISIHGRTVKQGYAGDADWNFIYELKKKAEKTCKVLGNGGIKTYKNIETILHSHSEQSEESNNNGPYTSLYSGGQSEILDGVMIGQAAIGNPWIFTPHTPSQEEIKDTILKHLDYMISYEKFFQDQKASYTGVLAMPDHLKIETKYIQTITLAEFRKHLFQYVKGIPGSKEFKQKVATIVEYEPLVQEIQHFFG